MQIETTAERLARHARARPEEAAYFVKQDGRWVPTSWSGYEQQVRQVARSLAALGVEKGRAVAILGFNRPEWVLAELASGLIGAVSVGIYTTSSPPEVQYVTDHSEARVILVENAAQHARVEAEWQRMPHLAYSVWMEGKPPEGDPRALSWEAFLARGEEVPEAVIDERAAAVEGSDLATLIYTSGTTGPPKGVMLSHANVSWTGEAAVAELLEAGPSDCLLSYLPLSHIAERMFSVHGAVAAGYSIYFAESGEKVAENLREVQPTLVFGVPRVWERMAAAVGARLAAAKGLRGALLDWARGIGRRVSELRCTGREPTGLLGLQYRLASRLVLSKVKTLLGLGRIRVGSSGAAPISRDVLDLFASLDVVIREVYGQSEDTGPTSFNRLARTRLGTVGPAIPGVEVKVAEDGEVLVKGPNVFQGYFKDPAATAETLVDGWLHSGDLGSFDTDGFLTITGRKKEILITSGGKNITPTNIEAALKDLELVADAMVVGEGRRYLTALLTLDPEAVARFAAEDVKAELEEGIARVNGQFARVEHVRAFRVLPEVFSIETGELTPTLKLKRRVVTARHAELIEAMYRSGE